MRTLAVPPTIGDSETTSKHSVVAGQSVSLDCPAIGVPQPDIHWTREGVAISSGNRSKKVAILEAGRRLRLYDVQPHDAGTYACFANNSAGGATKRLSVHVFGKYLAP